MTLRREIRWLPGYDHRADPEQRQYGCHGMDILWLLHGPKATIQFKLMTGWMPTWDYANFRDRSHDVLPADLGYHADEEQYEEQTRRECDCRPSGWCYYDGSGLAANDTFRILVTKGEEAVWKHMEEYYELLVKEKRA